MTFPNKGDKFLKKVVVLRRWEYYKIIWLSEIADTPHPLGTYIPDTAHGKKGKQIVSIQPAIFLLSKCLHFFGHDVYT